MAIHWWHTEHLAADLASDAVSEKQSFWYAFISNLLYYQAIYQATWFGGHRSWLLIMELIAVCLIAFIGLQECHKANGGSEGRDFVKRLFCLGVPIGLKLVVAMVLLGLVVQFAFPRFVTQDIFRNPYLVWQLWAFFVAGVFTVVYFWRIAYYMGRIARQERSNTLMQPTGQKPPAAD